LVKIKIRSHDASAASSLRGAKRRSNPEPGRRTGLLRFARNDDMEHHSRGAHAPEACQPPRRRKRRTTKEGSGAPRGASSNGRILRHGAGLRGPLAFRRSTAALAGTSERSSSAQAALHANKRMRALPAPSFALKQGTLRAGRNAGGA
jgi:hypothetical protein